MDPLGGNQIVESRNVLPPLPQANSPRPTPSNTWNVPAHVHQQPPQSAPPASPAQTNPTSHYESRSPPQNGHTQHVPPLQYQSPPPSRSSQVTAGHKEPRSPIREDDRRVTGSLDGAMHGDRMAVTNGPRSGHFPNVSRSYREFAILHEALAANNPHTIVPPVPFPNTSAPNPVDDDRLIASAFQQFFDRLLVDSSLRGDLELPHFLESDFGYTPLTKARRKLTSSGFGFSLSRSTSRTGMSEEEDELANAKLQFRLLEEKLAEASRAVEGVSKARRNLATAHAEASERLAAFSTTEEHAPLAQGWRKVSRAERAFADVEVNASVGEMVTLSDGLGWCAVQSKGGKDALKNRAGVLEEHLASAKRSIEKRRNIERFKASSSINPDKVDAALDELEEAKKIEEVLAQRAMAISTNLRPALRTHSKHLHDDLLYALMEHARTQTIYERQTLKELELLKPELRSIPEKEAGVVYVSRPGEGNPAMSRGKGVAARRGSAASSAYPSTPTSPSKPPNEHARYATVSGTQSMYAGSTSGRTSIDSGNGNSVDDPFMSASMLNTNTVGRSNRINDIARSVIVTQGDLRDRRQQVDAKSAAASLARLF